MLSILLGYDRKTAVSAVLTVFMLASTPAEGRQEWTCVRGKDIRKIRIEVDNYGRVPCRVIYEKPTEGFVPVEIGRAQRAFSFCEEKAEEVALKLQNSDWECEREDS